ncbi:MAG: M20/M25/M40 family metallo-hydrolase [Phycisphaerales bacterium]
MLMRRFVIVAGVAGLASTVFVGGFDSGSDGSDDLFNPPAAIEVNHSPASTVSLNTPGNGDGVYFPFVGSGGPAECGEPLSSDLHRITSNADSATSVFAIDLDGDTDIDVLSASSDDDTVAWYENDGATPPSFTEHIITTSADGAKGVFAIDLDGDTDIDVLSASSLDDSITWYENDGATPPSFASHVIAANADFATSVFAIDLDGDTDIDVLSSSGFGDSITWYENDGATPPSFAEHVITATANFAASVFAIDLDGDTDIDVLSASALDDTVAWYENDGAMLPSFTEHPITIAADGPQSVFAIDLDGDTDIDVLSASALDDSVAWYENDGATPPSFTEHIITTDADFAVSVFAIDLDGDPDVDVLSASIIDDKIAWYEMTAPSFGTCCLSDGSCLDAMCLADCAALLGWAWTPQNTCDLTDCPGADAPATFLVDNLSLENFTQIIADLAAFETRYWNLPGNDLAVAYLAEKLESFGYDNVVLDPYMFQGQQQFNVYATKIGKTRPLEMYILGAHLDSFNKDDNFEDAPGADDDAAGCASVLEMARVFAAAQTDVSIRFVFWNNEETGLDGSAAYVANHRDLQGTRDEPTWLGMIQQDMILFDHGPGKVPDADVEFQASAHADGHAAILAAFVAGAMQRYGDMPAEVGDNMDFTDSKSFWNDTAAISVRENQRIAEIGNGSNPCWHHPCDNPENYSAQDYEFGFNIVKMVAGAVGELANASPDPCPADLDDNGSVGASDLLTLLASWGPCEDCAADFDGNGSVGASDLLTLLANWGPCP